MKPKTIFKLAVRLFGLIFLYHGLLAFPTLFTGIFGNGRNAFASVLFVGWPLLVGFYVLRSAPKITEFFYPEAED